MRKLIPLKFQRIVMFIPFINALVLFLYLFNIHQSPDSVKLFSRSLPGFFASFIIPNIFFAIIGHFVSNPIINLVGIYLILICMDLYLIGYQKKNMNFPDNKKKG